MLTAVLFLLTAAVFCLAQPGDEGTISISVVDEHGREVRGASVDEASIGTGRPIFLGRGFPTAAERGFKPLFRPRDEHRSSFVAATYCKHDHGYAIQVKAPGYEPKVQTGSLRDCQANENVVLKRSSEPIPAFEPLTTLSGKLTDQNGRPITRRFLIVREGKEYVPLIAKDGSYSARLLPGLYEIIFNEFNCTEYTIRNYRLGDVPRVLTLTADCD